jgi:hypothetical protein
MNRPHRIVQSARKPKDTSLVCLCLKPLKMLFCNLKSQDTLNFDLKQYPRLKMVTAKPTSLIKKEKKIVLIYKEIQKGFGPKSYMTNGLLIYE